MWQSLVHYDTKHKKIRKEENAVEFLFFEKVFVSICLRVHNLSGFTNIWRIVFAMEYGNHIRSIKRDLCSTNLYVFHCFLCRVQAQYVCSGQNISNYTCKHKDIFWFNSLHWIIKLCGVIISLSCAIADLRFKCNPWVTHVKVI